MDIECLMFGLVGMQLFMTTQRRRRALFQRNKRMLRTGTHIERTQCNAQTENFDRKVTKMGVTAGAIHKFCQWKGQKNSNYYGPLHNIDALHKSSMSKQQQKERKRNGLNSSDGTSLISLSGRI